jgi:hypothetical protein
MDYQDTASEAGSSSGATAQEVDCMGRTLYPGECVVCGGGFMALKNRRYCDECGPLVRKLAVRAHHQVHKRISAGDLKPATAHACVDCSRPADVWDHRDYGNPLDVVPVCTLHNIMRGAADGFGELGERQRANHRNIQV